MDFYVTLRLTNASHGCQPIRKKVKDQMKNHIQIFRSDFSLWLLSSRVCPAICSHLHINVAYIHHVWCIFSTHISKVYERSQSKPQFPSSGGKTQPFLCGMRKFTTRCQTRQNILHWVLEHAWSWKPPPLLWREDTCIIRMTLAQLSGWL